jgi:hypothetical protein
MVVKSSVFFWGFLGLHTRLPEMPTPKLVSVCIATTLVLTFAFCIPLSASQESIAEMIHQVKAEVGSPFLAYQMDMWGSHNSKESYAFIMASVVWRNPETSLLELRQFCLEFGCFPFTRHTDDEEEDQAGTKVDCKSCVLPDEAQWMANRQLE